MKFVWFSLLCAFMILNACSTTERTQTTYPTATWSSSEPLSIPYDIRLNQFEKDNLVANPSFEAGRDIGVTTGDLNRINGWEMVGRNVRWVDHESADFNAEDVNSGRRAVKIIKKKGQ